ncbi:electron transport complex subunit RsxC [bacterium]|nr:electron transport complex subunit RsxC [bacterium]
MIKLRPFRGGVHPPENKHLSCDKEIIPIPAPKILFFPLSQHTGAPCQPIVQKGDKVKRGTLIGTCEKLISSPIHSSVSGTVKSIENSSHPVIGRFQSIVIENDKQDLTEESISPKKNTGNLSADEIIKIARDAGIVGLGGAAFPTHVKLSPPKEKVIKTFIANGAECEPYLTCDQRLMQEMGKEIVEGIKIVKQVVSPERCIIAIENNKPDAIEQIKELTRNEKIEVIAIKVKYPQGGEKQLIKTVLGKEVPSGGLPMDVGVVVHNVGTLLAIYEAVNFGKPLYERVITVTGKVKNPGNYLVRIGTPIKDILDFCQIDWDNVGKIILGGPMMGISQQDIQTPIIKGTSGILVQSKDEIIEDTEAPCIRCAKCIEVCPAYLLPTQIAKVVKAEKWERLSQLHIKDCMECGCCTYVCPSKIPLVQYIKLGKIKTK